MVSGRKMPAKLYLSVSASLSSFQTVDLMVCPMLPSCSIPSFLSSPLFAPSFLPLHPISPYFIWLLSCCFLVSLSVCLLGWGNARNKQRKKLSENTHTYSVCLSLSSLAFSLSLSLSLSLWCSHWHTYMLSLSLSLSDTHIKGQSEACVCVHSAPYLLARKRCCWMKYRIETISTVRRREGERESPEEAPIYSHCFLAEVCWFSIWD